MFSHHQLVQFRCQHRIDLSSGQINYIGASNANSSLDTNLINGLSFVKTGTDTGILHGIAGATDKLYSINTATGAATAVGDSYTNVKHVGMAVNFGTNQLYAVSAWADGMPDYPLKINPNQTPVVNDVHTTNTMGNYSWTTKYSGAGGTAGQASSVTHRNWNIKNITRIRNDSVTLSRTLICMGSSPWVLYFIIPQAAGSAGQTGIGSFLAEISHSEP